MENAGAAVAAAITQRYAPCRTVVLCGPGNNGGDGYVIARLLAERGWSVTVAQLRDPMSLKGDAAAMARLWRGVTVPMSSEVLDCAGLVIVALFGAGLSRPLEGRAKEVVEALSLRHVPTVAVDLPSGLQGDTGRPPTGGICAKADLTVTFFRLKPAHVLMPGRLFCGETVVADIGTPEAAIAHIAPQIFRNGPELWSARFPRPDPLQHKYARGHAVVVSGPGHATGAARLAARAALRVGAGLCSVASPAEAVAVNAAALTAIMVKPFSAAAGLASLLSDTRLNAVVIGPGVGVGPGTSELVAAVLATQAAVVIDADAITSFAGEPNLLFRLLRQNCVLTPHAGEFSRIFPRVLEQSTSRIEATRVAAAAAGCVVLLKGPDTVIADPSGRVAVNCNAPAWLATAGAGDVLAGIIAGLMAQGMTAFDGACAGAWLHGEAANLFGPGLISEDLPEKLPQVLRELEAGLPSTIHAWV